MVNVHHNPIASAGGNVAICKGESTTLNATGGIIYNWNNSISTSQNIVSPLNSSFYTVTVTDTNGCQNSDSVLVTVNPLPIVTFSPIANVCLNGTPFILIGGNPIGGAYSGAGVSAGIFNPLAVGVGSYSITYTYIDSNGCKDSATIPINVTPCTGIENVSNSFSVQLFPMFFHDSNNAPCNKTNSE